MRITTALLIALTLGLVHSTASANLLANPGFEDPITVDGPPFNGFWEAFSGSGDPFNTNPLSRNSTAMPRSGLQSLELDIDNLNNNFAGVFQDVLGLAAGQTATWSGWHLLIGDAGGIETRIEWRNSGTDTEISRTPNFVPTPGSSYEAFSLSAVVPAGADTARVVYAIQSFGSANNQTVYVDDVSFTTDAVETPAPATLGLLGLGGLMMLIRRRRRRA